MRVLVVEDDQRMSNLLRRSLEEEGYAVDVANDGPNGLWMAKEFPYAAIVLDVMLPGFDGFELCRQLRDAEIWTPVLMLTARDEIGDRVRGLDVGADDYLVKPFSLLELSARLRALSRRDDRARPTVLSVGDLRLDPAAKRAWRGETELSLSPKEMALLELFLRHPGTVLDRQSCLSGTCDSTRRRSGRGGARPNSPFPQRRWRSWNCSCGIRALCSPDSPVCRGPATRPGGEAGVEGRDRTLPFPKGDGAPGIVPAASGHCALPHPDHRCGLGLPIPGWPERH